MKQAVEKRKPNGITDYVALALTTWGVGYGPVAPGTWGSAVGVLIYLGVSGIVTVLVSSFSYSKLPVGPPADEFLTTGLPILVSSLIHVVIAIILTLFCLVGIWASNRSIPLLGNDDPSEAVVDEVIGQLITFCFIPFGLGWPFIVCGFLLFRLFDIWKPYPIDNLQILSGGLGVCADDIVAGVYAGICLAAGYAIYLAI